MPSFTIADDRDLQLAADPTLRSMFTLSPCVWRENGRFEMLIRAVNHDDDPAQKIARIYHGQSNDGLNFKMDDRPDIAPGPGRNDLHGCEDPSIAIFEDRLYVYYTGWNQDQKVGTLMLARGPNPCALQKAGVALDSTPTHANPKEATIAQRKDGSWALFFEYARDNRSRIGVASADHAGGPWHVGGDPIEARAGAWDGWHLSPGPIIPFNGGVLMFYNGSTRQIAWRIGWITFDADFSSIRDRGDQPIITPPPPKGEETDIAFAASAVCRADESWLYYSIADRQMKRAILHYR